MNKINLLKNQIMLILVLALCCVQLSAQDKITFTWQVPTDNCLKEAMLIGTADKTSKVNWGDGITEDYPNNAGLEHTYATSGVYTVSITANQDCQFTKFWCHGQNVTDLNFNDCNALEMVICIENSLTQLAVKGCAQLGNLHCEKNQLTSLTISDCPALTELYCFNNQLTQCNIVAPQLEFLDCNNNQLTQLDITTPKLEVLYCDNNQLTQVNTTAPKIALLSCVNNKLQLSDLYALHLLVENTNNKSLGAQNLLPKWVDLNTELFANQSKFEEIYTKYIVEMEGAPAPDSTYTITDGKLTFHRYGTYTVTMTNDVIISTAPAKVTVVIDVVPVSISENDFANFKVYPNPTRGELKIENGELKIENVEIFDVYGKKILHSPFSILNSIDISHFPAGIYFVKIRTEAGEVVKKVVKE